MGYNFFKDVSPDYFSSMDVTLHTMFQLILSDGWNDIVRPIQNKVPYSNSFFLFYLLLLCALPF